MKTAILLLTLAAGALAQEEFVLATADGAATLFVPTSRRNGYSSRW